MVNLKFGYSFWPKNTQEVRVVPYIANVSNETTLLGFGSFGQCLRALRTYFTHGPGSGVLPSNRLGPSDCPEKMDILAVFSGHLPVEGQFI